jgi:hypothetical protein
VPARQRRIIAGPDTVRSEKGVTAQGGKASSERAKHAFTDDATICG